MAWRSAVSITLWIFIAAAAAPTSVAQTPTTNAAATGAVDPAEKELLAAEGLLGRGQYDLARQEFDAFLTHHPKDPREIRARYGRAVAEYNLNDGPAAAADLQTVTADAKFPRRDEALSLLGAVQLQLGQLQPAADTLKQLIKDYPKSPQVESAEVNRAQALYRLKKYNDSLTAVRDLLQQYPRTSYRASALYVGALDQRALGDDKEAARTIGVVISEYPNSPFIYNAQLMMGEILAAQGKFAEAIKHYQDLQNSAPESERPAIQFGLATTYLQAGQYPQAEEAFSKIVQEYPRSQYAPPAALQKAVSQVKSGRRDQARASLAAVGRQYPALMSSVDYWQARCDLLDNHFAAAARQLERVVGTGIPEEPDAEFDLAYCELRLGHADVALQRLETFRQKYPRSSRIYQALYYEASALYQTGKYDKAIEFADVSAKSPDEGIARESSLLKGEALLMQGQYAKADAVFAPLAESSTNEDERLRLELRRGQCAYFAGNFKAAEEQLTPVAANPLSTHDPLLHEAGFLLGDAQLQQNENEKAAATLKAYLATATTRREEAAYKLATAEQHLNDTAAATQTLDELMRGDPKSPWVQRAWYDAARLAFENHDPEQAAHDLATLLEAKPEEAIAAPALYLVARVEISQGKNAAAAEHLQQLVQAYPRNALAEEAMYARGVALKDAQQMEAAEKQFAIYLQTYPNGKFATDARHQRAVALVGSNNPADAVKILSDLAKNPATRNDSVLYDLAWAYRNNHELPKAIDAYRTLLKDFSAAPQATPARVELAQLLYADQKYADAKSELVAALNDPRIDAHQRAVAIYWTACCDAALGNAKDAAATFDNFVRQSPSDPLVPRAISEAGDAYATLGEYPRAIAHQQKVLADYPKSDAVTLAQLRLGETQNQAGDYAAAEKTLTAFLHDHPDSKLAPRAQFGIGWSLENRNQYEAARDQYAKVIAADNGPTAARAQFQTGETYFAQKQYETAARELLKTDILYNAPTWAARALYEAGRAFEELHEPDKARQQFTDCIKKYPNADITPLARKRLEALTSANH